jgi:hypothetical protein
MVDGVSEQLITYNVYKERISLSLMSQQHPCTLRKRLSSFF